MKKLLSLVLAIALLLGVCAFTASAEEDRPTLRMLQRLNAAYESCPHCGKSLLAPGRSRV